MYWSSTGRSIIVSTWFLALLFLSLFPFLFFYFLFFLSFFFVLLPNCASFRLLYFLSFLHSFLFFFTHFSLSFLAHHFQYIQFARWFSPLPTTTTTFFFFFFESEETTDPPHTVSTFTCFVNPCINIYIFICLLLFL